MRRRDAVSIAKCERMWAPAAVHPDAASVREHYQHQETQFRRAYDFELRHHRLNADGLRLCSLALFALRTECRDNGTTLGGR